MSSANSIRDWLSGLGLAQYAGAFEQEQIDLDAVRHLTGDDLKDLGLPMGHRAKLLAAIRALQETAGQAPGEEQTSSPQSYTPRHLAEKILTSRSALEGERKQVTVLFCDIANSTQLAERVGAEAMHGILSRFFELALEQVHRYEGTVNQFLGDGFMALFGAPVAHEDDARRGVLSALGIRRALADADALPGLPAGVALSVRMGLHTGPVVVGSIGDNLRMDYTAIGDTTNLAARLEQHAPSGEILVSEVTARLVKGYVNVEPLPPLAVKGKAEPISAFRVTAAGQRRSRLDHERALSPFVGREREIATLREALEEVLAGRGQVVGIVGEPGVGKSRVLYEFRRLLAERDVAYLEGWCQSFGQSIPYLPLQDVLRAVCGIEDSDSPAQVAQRVQAASGKLGLSPQEDAPYLLRLLGLDQGGESLIGLTPEAIQAHTLEVLARAILAQGRDRPLVVGIEDLHWIDKSSEAFLVHLVESLAGAPILLLTTSRPGYSPPGRRTCVRAPAMGATPEGRIRGRGETGGGLLALACPGAGDAASRLRPDGECLGVRHARKMGPGPRESHGFLEGKRAGARREPRVIQLHIRLLCCPRSSRSVRGSDRVRSPRGRECADPRGAPVGGKSLRVGADSKGPGRRGGTAGADRIVLSVGRPRLARVLHGCAARRGVSKYRALGEGARVPGANRRNRRAVGDQAVLDAWGTLAGRGYACRRTAGGFAAGPAPLRTRDGVPRTIEGRERAGPGVGWLRAAPGAPRPCGSGTRVSDQGASGLRAPGYAGSARASARSTGGSGSAVAGRDYGGQAGNPTFRKSSAKQERRGITGHLTKELRTQSSQPLRSPLHMYRAPKLRLP